MGVYILYIFIYIFIFFPWKAKDGESTIKVGAHQSIVGVNTDMTVLIKPSSLVAVRWPRGVNSCACVLK